MSLSGEGEGGMVAGKRTCWAEDSKGDKKEVPCGAGEGGGGGGAKRSKVYFLGIHI